MLNFYNSENYVICDGNVAEKRTLKVLKKPKGYMEIRFFTYVYFGL